MPTRKQLENAGFGFKFGLAGVIVFFTGLIIGGILLFVARRADKTPASPANVGPTFARPAAGPVPPPSGRGRIGSVL